MSKPELPPMPDPLAAVEAIEPATYVELQLAPVLFSEIGYPLARRFLEVYSRCKSLIETERITGTAVYYHYFWRKISPAYAAAFEQAKEYRADHLEDKIFEGGYEGYDESLSYKGKLTGDKVKRRHPELAIVAAKALRPHKYRENSPQVAVISAPMRVTFNINLPDRTNSVKLDGPQTLEIKAED